MAKQLRLTSDQKFHLSTIKNAGAMNSTLRGVYEKIRKMDTESSDFDFYATVLQESKILQDRLSKETDGVMIYRIEEAAKHLIGLLPEKYLKNQTQLEKVESNEIFTFGITDKDWKTFAAFVATFKTFPIFGMKSDSEGNIEITSKDENFIDKLFNHLS